MSIHGRHVITTDEAQLKVGAPLIQGEPPPYRTLSTRSACLTVASAGVTAPPCPAPLLQLTCCLPSCPPPVSYRSAGPLSESVSHAVGRRGTAVVYRGLADDSAGRPLPSTHCTLVNNAHRGRPGTQRGTGHGAAVTLGERDPERSISAGWTGRRLLGRPR